MAKLYKEYYTFSEVLHRWKALESIKFENLDINYLNRLIDVGKLSAQLLLEGCFLIPANGEFSYCKDLIVFDDIKNDEYNLVGFIYSDKYQKFDERGLCTNYQETMVNTDVHNRIVFASDILTIELTSLDIIYLNIETPVFPIGNRITKPDEVSFDEITCLPEIPLTDTQQELIENVKALQFCVFVKFMGKPYYVAKEDLGAESIHINRDYPKKELPIIGLNPAFTYVYQSYLHYENNVVIPADDLKNFEQKQGFFDHELNIEKAQNRSKKISNIELHNEKIAKVEKKAPAKSVKKRLLELKKTYPHWNGSSRFVNKLAIEFKVSPSTIRNRLKE